MEFPAMGLVLSTNLGEVIAVLIAFEALHGKLEVLHIPAANFHSPYCDGVKAVGKTII